MARIPIQERDVAQSQPTPGVRLPERAPITPVSGETRRGFAELAAANERRAKAAEAKAKEIARARYTNMVNSHKIKAISSLADAEGENAMATANLERSNFIKALERENQNVNDEWRTEFSEIGNSYLNEFDRFSLGHQFKENDKVADAAFQTRIGQTVGDATLLAVDPVAFDSKLDELTAISAKYDAIKLGGDPERGIPASPEARNVAVQNAKRYRSQTILQAIKLFGAQGDEPNLKRMLQKYDSDLEAADKTQALQIAERVKDTTRVNNAFELMKIAQQQYPDNPQQAVDFITKAAGDDGELYKTARAMYQSDMAFQSQQRKLENEAKTISALDEVDRTGQITSGTLKQIQDVTERQKIMEYQRRVALNEYGATDDALFNDLFANEEKLLGTDLRALRHRINRDDLATLERLKQQAIQRDRSDKEKIQYSVTKDMKDITIRVAREYGLNPSIHINQMSDVYRLSDDVLSEVKLEFPDIKNPALFREKVEQKLRQRMTSIPKIEKLFGEGGIDIKRAPIRGNVLSEAFDPTGPTRESMPTARERAHPDYIRRLQEARRSNNKPELTPAQLEERLRYAEETLKHNITKPTGR